MIQQGGLAKAQAWGCLPKNHLELESLVLALVQHFICFYLFPLSFVLVEFFNNFALLPIFFSLYPNPQKFQKYFSFYYSVLRDSNASK
jgi:hypothetical protein